jgi:hypothetical protein
LKCTESFGRLACKQGLGIFATKRFNHESNSITLNVMRQMLFLWFGRSVSRHDCMDAGAIAEKTANH